MSKAEGLVGNLMSSAEQVWDKVAPIAKTALHWGFIPAIIVVGMTCTDPKPSLAQLLGPM
jgi:mitochondrial import receptor subunit TOM7